jgi:hypothetical protein
VEDLTDKSESESVFENRFKFYKKEAANGSQGDLNVPRSDMDVLISGIESLKLEIEGYQNYQETQKVIEEQLKAANITIGELQASLNEEIMASAIVKKHVLGAAAVYSQIKIRHSTEKT